MPKASKSTKALPPALTRAVATLGRDISTARKRRRIPQRLFAQRMMVSLDTVQRLEHGDPGIGIGVLATALWLLGLSDRLTRLASPETDTVGNTEEIERLPRRVRTKMPAGALDF